MRKLFTLSFLFLSLALPVAAQKTLTIKNVRFYTLPTNSSTDKVVVVDELTADIYAANDIIHVKVFPCEPIVDGAIDDKEIVTLGTITITSEKKIARGNGVAITFDLTDGDVTFPCLYSAPGRFIFLHKSGNEEVVFRKHEQSLRVQLFGEPQSMAGYAVSTSFRVALFPVQERASVSGGSRTQRRSNTKRREP